MIGVFQGVGNHPPALFVTLKDFNNGFSERRRVSRFKKAHDGVIEIKVVNPRARNHHRHAQGHEFHDFGAVCLITERIRPLGHNAQVGIRHDSGDFRRVQQAKKAHSLLHSQFMDKSDEIGFGTPFSVNVKLGLGQTIL